MCVGLSSISEAGPVPGRARAAASTSTVPRAIEGDSTIEPSMVAPGSMMSCAARMPPLSSPVAVMVALPPQMHMEWIAPSMRMLWEAMTRLAMTLACWWTRTDSVVMIEVPQCPLVISMGRSLRLPLQCGHDADSAYPETVSDLAQR